MQRQSMGEVCLEFPPTGERDKGIVYNKPFVHDGPPRRVLGDFIVTSGWRVSRRNHEDTPMISVRVKFNSGQEAIGRRKDSDGCLEVYEAPS
jgi:hypothetical protein